MAEIWGYCADCDRWFYCPQWFERGAPAATCPVCSAEPREIVNRGVAPPATA